MKRQFTRDVSDFIWAELTKMNKKELEHVLKECDSLNTHNCSWVRYDLRHVIKEVTQHCIECLDKNIEIVL